MRGIEELPIRVHVEEDGRFLATTFEQEASEPKQTLLKAIVTVLGIGLPSAAIVFWLYDGDKSNPAHIDPPSYESYVNQPE